MSPLSHFFPVIKKANLAHYWCKATCILILLAQFPANQAYAEDWPQWRYDAGHRANTPQELPANLHLQWVRKLPHPKAAWPIAQHKLQFDKSYEPIVMGKRIYVPSMVRDKVTALDTETGEIAWEFFTAGPVRFAPVGWQGKLYFVSDDGYLYCLDAESGDLLWKFQGGPSEYKVLGNERLISMWPARGAPVIHEGKVFFAASIWPFMGTFIHALDASSGEVVWTNSSSASDFILQPHNSPAFAGVAPQGYMSISGDKLLVASGRSVPAVYDRHTGQFLYFHANTKRGNYAVYVNSEWFLNDGYLHRLSDGQSLFLTEATVLDNDAMYGIGANGRIHAASLSLEWKEAVDRKGNKVKQAEFKTIWARQTDPALDKVFIKSGSRLYAGNKDGIIAGIEIPRETRTFDPKIKSPSATISWQTQITGEPWTMLAADKKLFVVTVQGDLYCFGDTASNHIHQPESNPKINPQSHWTNYAHGILDKTGIQDGYALVVGVGTGQLMEALVRQSNIHVIGLDKDAEKVDRLRRKFDQSGLYGNRITILDGSILETPISPYMASLVVSENIREAGYNDDSASDFIKRVYHVLRPYGGTACLPLEKQNQHAFQSTAELANLSRSVVSFQDEMALLQRVGPLADSAPWTHQYGDAANSVFSKDKRVKGPLGLLWFGGSSHIDVLPRHGHGPPQQVMGGRLFLEGIKMLSARDVYTGRVLWKKDLPELDTYDMYYNATFNPDIYDRSYNQKHIPGANAWGSNFVVAHDRIYLINGPKCLVIDPVTGDTLDEWILEKKPELGTPNWGSICVYKDLLIAGTSPLRMEEKDKILNLLFNNRYAEGSQFITVLDRYTGKVLWERKADYNFRHNTIIAGNDKVFCIDGLSPSRTDFWKRRGMQSEGNPRVLALDAQTGQELWTEDEKVFGTWLSFSDEYDILLQAGASAKDRARDEVGQGMTAFNGTTGKRLWYSDEKYDGPPILHHDRILTQTGGGNQEAHPAKTFNLLTGEKVFTEHPLTGDMIPCEWIRFKGCNTAIASEHLLTFRSASAAYVDLSQGLGTTSIGGFKSGCTSNLVVADGVLNAPDYTRTCTCSYQNQTSLALVHFPTDDAWYPAVESWSFDYLPTPETARPVKRIGINFGAPGNRMGTDGTLWLEYPSVGGPSPDIPILIEGKQPKLFRHSASISEQDEHEALDWVAASGLQGVHSITIRPFVQPTNHNLNNKGQVDAFASNALNQSIKEDFPDAVGSFKEPKPFTVRLYFAEPDGKAPGERVFDVQMQNKTVLKNFDMTTDPNHGSGLVKEFKGILIKDTLNVIFIEKSSPASPPLICGIELIEE